MDEVTFAFSVLCFANIGTNRGSAFCELMFYYIFTLCK